MRINWFKDAQGEPRLWSFGINESAKKRPGAWPLAYRWFLMFPGGEFHIEYWLFKRSNKPRLMLGIGGGDTDRQLCLSIGLPWLIALYLVFDHAWLKRLAPTHRVASYKGGYWDMPIERQIGFFYSDGRFWVKLWADTMDPDRNRFKWQEFNWGLRYIADLLFGKTRYYEAGHQEHDEYIIMPEGAYRAKIVTYLACWKRPRWPFVHRVHRANIEIPGGIPVPGKGDNSWDMDDDAICSIGTIGANLYDLRQQIYESAMRDRVRYASAAWFPAGGWPDHCLDESEVE
jgi:hypothetical protein